MIRVNLTHKRVKETKSLIEKIPVGKQENSVDKPKKNTTKTQKRPRKPQEYRKNIKLIVARANTTLGEPTVRPEPVPTLKGKCAKEFAKQMQLPPSRETIRIFKEAGQVSRKVKQIK